MKVLVAARQETARNVAVAATAIATGIGFEIETDAGRVLARLGNDDTSSLLLLDFDLPGLTGLKGIQTARRSLGDKPLGVLMHGANFELAKRAIAAGAQGVLPHDISPASLEHTVSLLANGHNLALVDRVMPVARLQVADALSERELQVLDGVSRGLQNKEIAHSFQIQEVTVKMHVRAIIRKLGARNRTHAAMIARDLGIV